MADTDTASAADVHVDDVRRAHLVTGAGVTALILALMVALVAAVVLGIAVGTVTLPLRQIWDVIGHHLGLVSKAPDRLQNQIIWEFRTPRVLLAAIVGAGLSVAGVCLQVLARNGLADPYVLGVSSGAALGAVIVLSYGTGVVGGLGVSGAAVVAAMLTMVLVFTLAQRGGQIGPTRLVLAGVAVSYLATAATSFLQLYLNPNELRGIMFWLLGSLAGASWDDLRAPTIAIVASMAWLIGRGRAMNALTAGDDSAVALGVDVHRLRIELLVISSLLTGAAVSVAGGIGFVGLMVPHAVRFIVGPDHRKLLPVSMIAGAVFMVLVDLASRIADRPNELPVGIFTAALGAPFFLILLRRTGRGAP